MIGRLRSSSRWNLSINFRIVHDLPLYIVAREFASFDISDVLAKLGGLRLMPENACRAARLELAASVAAGCAYLSDKPYSKVNQLRRILNGPQISDPQRIPNENPIGGWFLESVSFVDGAFLVLPGITTNATFIQRHIGAVLALIKTPFRIENSLGPQSN